MLRALSFVFLEFKEVQRTFFSFARFCFQDWKWQTGLKYYLIKCILVWASAIYAQEQDLLQQRNHNNHFFENANIIMVHHIRSSGVLRRRLLHESHWMETIVSNRFITLKKIVFGCRSSYGIWLWHIPVHFSLSIACVCVCVLAIGCWRHLLCHRRCLHLHRRHRHRNRLRNHRIQCLFHQQQRTHLLCVRIEIQNADKLFFLHIFSLSISLSLSSWNTWACRAKWKSFWYGTLKIIHLQSVPCGLWRYCHK